MSDRRNTAITWMLVLLLATAGCGRGGDGKQSTAAAIPGQAGASPTTVGIKACPVKSPR